MILTSTKAEPERPINEYDVGFATKTIGASKTYTLQIRIPRKLLGEIGDPKRIMIEGKPAEGYTIRSTDLKHEGHAVNYNLPGHVFFFTVAFKPTKLTKVIRRMTVAHARRVDEDHIRVGGMPLGWIKGEDPYVGKTPKVALATEGGTRLPANPKSGTMRRPPEPAAPTPKDEAAAITARLNAALDTARTLRTALEQQTGLKFKVTQHLRLILAEK